jgi:rubrerythrin
MMKVYICEICGDAYIGTEKPHDCPFCGAKGNFIKIGSEAKPIVNEKIEISETSKKNLLETLKLETEANAIYLCMAGKAASYEIKAMYKRIAKVELEHAVIATKLMGIPMPEIAPETCADENADNFKRTIELEDHAVELYRKFASEAVEDGVRKFFGAIMQAEDGHAELIKNYL